VRLPCDAALTETVARFVERLGRQAELGDDRLYWLRLAVDEITTNIAHHGYRDGAGVVDLTGEVFPSGEVRVLIEDDAPPFDPRSYDARARLSVDMPEREPGGLGLLLALSHLDGFDYDHDGGRNRNVLVVRRTP